MTRRCPSFAAPPFRQIGLAASVAALGSILATKLSAHHDAPGAFTDGLNTILLIAAILAITTGALAFALIRRSDLVTHHAAAPATPDTPATHQQD